MHKQSNKYNNLTYHPSRKGEKQEENNEFFNI